LTIALAWYYFRLSFITSLIKTREKEKSYDDIDYSDIRNYYKLSYVERLRYAPTSARARPAILSFIFHTLISILGYTISPFFTSLHLLLIINISNNAKYVIQSITLRANQLITTSILACFMIYSYSILTTEFLYEDFTADLREMQICSSIFSCFLYSLNLGLRNGGGIADSMQLVL
jgi:hypothetical protein